MSLFKDLFRIQSRPAARSVAGLFGIAGLRQPNDLQRFARMSLSEARGLYQSLKTPLDPRSAVVRLDTLSDTLCRAVDLAAFLRIAHPVRDMADAAQQAHETLFGFMSELNTDKHLYDVVNTAIKSGLLNSEELRVAEILRHDFMKSGIQLNSAKTRENFVNLSTQVSISSQQFLMNIGNDDLNGSHTLELSPSELSGIATLAPLAAQRFRIKSSQQSLLQLVMANSNLSYVRKKAWKTLKSVPQRQVRLLTQILDDRLELAQLAGYANFAEYELSDKLMQNPETVNKFLSALARHLRPKVKQELRKLNALVSPWDYAYHLDKYRKSHKVPAGHNKFSFDLVSVFDTIAKLAEELYGLCLEPADAAVEEVWAPDVRKINVKEAGEVVGTIYLDLMSRQGKQPHPAHYTIQCSRMRSDGSRQLPIIVLVCDFTETSSRTVHISFDEVQTIFHEMGHALHSMIGRTALHNVSGTRCATDFVELPSILMEKFTTSPRVLKELNPNMDVEQFRLVSEKQQKLSENYEMWYQLQLSYTDQFLHGEPFAKTRDAQLCANQVVDELNVFDAPSSDCCTSQFASIGHLTAYGATYYSYLLDRCLAQKVYKDVFAGDWAAGGAKFKNELLRWGGARDPRECLTNLLGYDFQPEKLVDV